MLGSLKRIWDIWTTDHGKYTETALFFGSAYFSNRVPMGLMKEWGRWPLRLKKWVDPRVHVVYEVAHGGQISSGPNLDVRARYFFAMDPSDSWATKLSAKSVVVIHAGWIAHCIEETFLVPMGEYVLDDKFIPGHPYKLTTSPPRIYIPLSDSSEPMDTKSGEDGPIRVPTSDTPSTPTSMPRKRKREQAYFDSPSGSLVFSGFDKDGLPRRPKKQRKLRFGPLFSPDNDQFGRALRAPGLDWLRDQSNALEDDGALGKPRGRREAHVPFMGTARAPDTPDKLPPCERLTIPTCMSPPADFVDDRKKIPVRTIDFTNLPPPTRRWRFPGPVSATKSTNTGMVPSTVKATENKVKTPKKISFADHARICVYPVSPQRLDVPARGPAQHGSDGDLEGGPEANGPALVVEDRAKTFTGTKKDLAPQSRTHDEGPTWRLGRSRENGTLTLTAGEVEAMRHRLLEGVAANGVDDGQLATLFELGKSFRGMVFRHEW